MNDALVARREHLGRKLLAVRRLAGHLDYSRGRQPYPLTSLDALDEPSLESVSALVERFGKLQDLLGGVFREMLLLSGDPAEDMNDILVRMEKLGILATADDWRALRALRNLGAHDYDDDDRGKTAFVNEVAAQSAQLIAVADRVAGYCRERLGVTAG